jgi:hypothetical protein
MIGPLVGATRDGVKRRCTQRAGASRPSENPLGGLGLQEPGAFAVCELGAITLIASRLSTSEGVVVY